MNAINYWYQKYLIEKNKKEMFVDKVCKWLINNTYKYLIDNTHFGGTGDINMQKLIEDFRKAMGE